MSRYRKRGLFFIYITDDGIVKNRMDIDFVIPAKAGIQSLRRVVDSGACPGLRSGVRLSDGFQNFLQNPHR